jgi:hypothetical protein
VFTATRQITATGNPTYDVTQSPLLQSLVPSSSSGSGTPPQILSGNSLAQVGALLTSLVSKSQSAPCSVPASFDQINGACSPSDSTPCCGNGQCVTGPSGGPTYVCKCTSAWAGLYCDKNATALAQMQQYAAAAASSLVTTVGQLTGDPSQVTGALNLITSVSGSGAGDAATLATFTQSITAMAGAINDPGTLSLYFQTANSLQAKAA